MSVAGFVVDEGDYGGRNMLASSGGGDDFLLEFAIAANELFGGRIGVGASNNSIPGLSTVDGELFFGALSREDGVGSWATTNTQTGTLETASTGTPNVPAHPFTFLPLATGDPATGGPFIIVDGKTLTQQECKSLYENFWQIFKPQTIMVPAGDAVRRRLVTF